MDLALIQQFLNDHQLAGWLIYDFRGNNPVLRQLLGGDRWTTRRVALFISAAGRARLAVHRIDAPQFESVDADKTVFLTWQDWQQWLRETVRGKVAMEFSDHGLLPAVGIVDAGTVDFIRSLGGDVVSSADLMQLCVARWSPAAGEAHLKASKLVNTIKDEAFGLIRSRLRDRKRVTEYGVQQFIMRRFAEEKLDPATPPIVAANAHSADPHFEVSATTSDEIRRGDWVLIDLWARFAGEENIFSDITWVGFAGDIVPPEHQQVFEVVKRARDAALQTAIDAWTAKRPIGGCDIDDAAMRVFRDAGHESHIIHRTGHSLSPGPKIHGLGVNIDNFETRDTRTLLPGIGFTIEPALYLPGKFGCRLEINVYVDAEHGPVVTSEVQRDVVRLA